MHEIDPDRPDRVRNRRAGFTVGLVTIWLLCLFAPLALPNLFPDDAQQVVAWSQLAITAGLSWLVYRSFRSDTTRLVLVMLTPGLLVASHVNQLGNGLFWDSVNTFARAAMILEGGGIPSGTERLSSFYFVVAAWQALFGTSGPSVHLLTLVVAVGFLLTSWALACRLFDSITADYFVCLLASVGPIFAVSHWLYIDLFMATLCVSSLWALDRALERPTRGRLAVFASLAILCVLSKEYSVVCVPAAFAMAITRRRGALGSLIRWFTATRIALLALAIVVPVGVATHSLLTGFWSTSLRRAPEFKHLILVPGNPNLSIGDQARVVLSLLGHNLALVAGTGLLGLAVVAVLSLNSRSGRGQALSVGLVLLIGSVIPALQSRSFGDGLWINVDRRSWLLVVALAAILLLLRMWLRIGVEWHTSLWVPATLAATSTVFFSLVGRVGPSEDGGYVGIVDWRYPILAYMGAALAAAFALRNVAVTSSGGGSLRVPIQMATTCAVVTLSGVLLGTNDLKITSSYQRIKLEAAIVAKDIVQGSGGTVFTHWPYYYPGAHRRMDYCEVAWEQWDVPLGSVLGANPASRGVAILDTAAVRQPPEVLRGAPIIQTLSDVNYMVMPGRWETQERATPEISVISLAGIVEGRDRPEFWDDFVITDSETGTPTIDPWQGLYDVENWGATTVRWTQGNSSTAVLPWKGEPQGVTLWTFSGRFYSRRELANQRLRVSVNGRDVCEFQPVPGWSELTCKFEDATLGWAERNELQLEIDKTLRPRDIPELESNDPREIAVAVDWVRLAAENPRRLETPTN